MSGLLDFLSPLLTQGTRLVATAQATDAQSKEDELSRLIQGITLKRKFASQDVEDQLHQAQTKKALAPTRHYDTDRGVMVNEDEGTSTPVAGVTPKDPVKQAVQIANATKGIPTYGDLHPKEHYTATSGTDENGNPIVAVVDTNTGKVSRSDVGKPVAGGGLAGANQSRIATAQQLSEDADKLMTAYEDQLLAKTKNISPQASALAKVMLAGGATASAAAEYALNKLDPELAQYARAAKEMATAERLITPRGGSNSLMHAEGVLSQAGPGANQALITQARNFRKAFRTGVASPGKSVIRGGLTESPSAKDASGDIDLSASQNPFADLVPKK
jgi:hypothetical protein